MAYNQHRMNIRNAMVGMTIAEAQAFRVTKMEYTANRCIDYIDEFIRELEDEWDALWRCPVCKEVVGVDSDYDDIPYCADCDFHRCHYDPVDVLFLRDGDIFAAFPGLGGSLIDATNITCYASVGQHGSCALRYCDECEEVTDPTEYADLAAELDSIGYNLRVIGKEQLIERVR